MDVQPNLLASLILLIWLPLSLVIASIYPRKKAFLLIVLGGILFLPERLFFDLPLLPAIEKDSVVAGSGLIACWLFSKEKGEDRSIPKPSWMFGLLVLLGALLTGYTNRDAVTFGIVRKQGIGLYDGFHAALAYLVNEVSLFFLGQVIFRNPKDFKYLLWGLVIAALVYVPLVLFEIRMSPQLNKMVYGFFQHDWRQMKRAGGFRAIVFMAHGLSVAFLISQALIALVGLKRFKDLRLPGISKGVAVALLILTLILSKSVASMLYAAVAVALLSWARPGLQFLVARFVAIFALSYPTLLLTKTLSTQWMVDLALSFSAERAQSLEYRFVNEEALLEHARERFLFGWGGSGRNRVFDPFTGQDVSTSDGEWVIRLTAFGFWNFLVNFLFLLIPVFLAYRASKRATPEEVRILATGALLMAFLVVDLLPNSSWHNFHLVIAGALWSTSREVIRQARLRRRGATPHQGAAPA